MGEVNDREKQSFLGKALALLFPINWPEPFGLVMIEAMACGTPVIAWPRGSVPEVIEDGVTGFIVETEADAAAAIGRARALIEAAFAKHLSGGLVRVEWPKHTLRAIKLC